MSMQSNTPLVFCESDVIQRVRGLFCDQCGYHRTLTACSHPGCHIGLCVKTATRTGCLNAAELEGRLWYCPNHNNPLKIKYNINNIGRTGRPHAGRTLVPLLQLIIVPGEIGGRTDISSQDYITPHLNSLYKHYPKPLFCTATYSGMNGHSIKNFRQTAMEWMEQHRHSAVLITLIAHSTVTTGEIVYARPGGQENLYASVDLILSASLGDVAYEHVITKNSGMKGIISTACGFTFQHAPSFNSWSGLVTNGTLDWVLAFGAPMLVRRHVMPFLHQFVEYAFLRDADSHGCLLGTQLNNLADSVQRTFVDRTLFAHTSVILIHRPSASEGTLLQEYVYSSRLKPWGYMLPSCEFCGNGNVVAPIRNGVARIKCIGCSRREVGSGTSKPAHVVMVHNRHAAYDEGNTFCWRKMDLASPWGTLQWTD